MDNYRMKNDRVFDFDNYKVFEWDKLKEFQEQIIKKIPKELFEDESRAEYFGIPTDKHVMHIVTSLPELKFEIYNNSLFKGFLKQFGLHHEMIFNTQFSFVSPTDKEEDPEYGDHSIHSHKPRVGNYYVSLNIPIIAQDDTVVNFYKPLTDKGPTKKEYKTSKMLNGRVVTQLSWKPEDVELIDTCKRDKVTAIRTDIPHNITKPKEFNVAALLRMRSEFIEKPEDV